jgi:hypothetical protein
VKDNFSGNRIFRGGSETLTVGDSSSNSYQVNFTCYTTSSTPSSITVKVYANNVFKGSKNIIPSLTGVTSNVNIVSSLVAPSVKLEYASGGQSGDYIRGNFVDYPTQVEPNTPEIFGIDNTPTFGDTQLRLRSSAYVCTDQTPQKRREVQIYKTSNNDLVTTINLDPGVYTYTIKGLTQYTEHKIRIRDVSTANLYSEWSSYTTKTTRSKPATPVGTNDTIGGTTAVLDSSAYSNADGGTHATSSWVLAKVSDSSVAYNDENETDLLTVTVSGLTEGESYDWYVRHRSSYGVFSNYSDLVRFTTQPTGTEQRAITLGGIISAQFTRGIALGAIIIDDPDLRRIYVGAIIGDKITRQIKLGAIIEEDPWEQAPVSPASPNWQRGA